MSHFRRGPMKHSSRGSRTPANLSETVNRQLNMYALAASAAGVGVLALAQPANARIVFTHANKTLGYGVLNLDLNHDGKPDFAFCLSYILTSSSTSRHPYSCPSARRRTDRRHVRKVPGERYSSALSIYPTKLHKKQNQILGNASGAYALPAGIAVGSIGAKQEFTAGARDMATWGSVDGIPFYSGPWRNAEECYLALKFIIDGEVHYGWARLNVNSSRRVHALLTGYAYETIPNKPIITGRTKGPHDPPNEDFSPGASLTNPIPDKTQPTSLGALAMGAPGLSIWRRSW